MNSNILEDAIKVMVPSSKRGLDFLYPVCNAVLKMLDFTSKTRHGIMVAVSEGFTNAFIHGNQKNPGTEIMLTFCIGENSLKILIEDEGLLPIKDNINQLVDKVDLSSSSGRGIKIMNELVDNVYYERDNKGFNRLILECFYSGNKTMTKAAK